MTTCKCGYEYPITESHCPRCGYRNQAKAESATPALDACETYADGRGRKTITDLRAELDAAKVELKSAKAQLDAVAKGLYGVADIIKADQPARVGLPEKELPKVGEPVDVVPERIGKGDDWFRTRVSRVIELAGARGRFGFEVHGRDGLFLPADEVGVGNIETWRRIPQDQGTKGDG
jgi:hypothetical protein